VFHQWPSNQTLPFSIQRARQEGHFNTIKGRGKPLERVNEEHNPFIAREEFLMNRIVQRQGAAPPWVEIQGELEAAVDTFRSVLRQSWVRRVVRMLTLSRQPLRELSLADAQALRDREWEAREKAYHESALAEVNALVRKYNSLAPYAVRRAYYVRDVELDRAYEEGAEDIIQELAERFRGSQAGAGNPEDRAVRDEEDEQTVMRVQSQGNVLRLRDLFRQWFRGRWYG
jgi:DnaJ family protein C protein 28